MAVKPRDAGSSAQEKPEKKTNYIPPQIITYSQDEVIEIIGPALACSPVDCGVGP